MRRKTQKNTTKAKVFAGGRENKKESNEVEMTRREGGVTKGKKEKVRRGEAVRVDASLCVACVLYVHCNAS